MALLSLILLAAGKSDRLGFPKPLITVDGVPLIAWQLRRFCAAGGSRAIVVLGYHADPIRPAIPQVDGLKVEVIRNPAPERGPFSSLQLALGALSTLAPSGAGAFVLPIDVPGPGPAVWRQLAIAASARTPAVIPTYEGHGGHPVALSATTCAALLQVPLSGEDARLDRQLARLGAMRVPVDDPAVTLNLNTAGDWEAWGNGRAAGPR
jgi:molybdenum cofactor cytidylyltransferase